MTEESDQRARLARLAKTGLGVGLSSLFGAYSFYRQGVTQFIPGSPYTGWLQYLFESLPNPLRTEVIGGIITDALVAGIGGLAHRTPGETFAWLGNVPVRVGAQGVNVFHRANLERALHTGDRDALKALRREGRRLAISNFTSLYRGRTSAAFERVSAWIGRYPHRTPTLDQLRRDSSLARQSALAARHRSLTTQEVLPGTGQRRLEQAISARYLAVQKAIEASETIRRSRGKQSYLAEKLGYHAERVELAAFELKEAEEVLTRANEDVTEAERALMNARGSRSEPRAISNRDSAAKNAEQANKLLRQRQQSFETINEDLRIAELAYNTALTKIHGKAEVKDKNGAVIEPAVRGLVDQQKELWEKATECILAERDARKNRDLELKAFFFPLKYTPRDARGTQLQDSSYNVNLVECRDLIRVARRPALRTLQRAESAIRDKQGDVNNGEALLGIWKTEVRESWQTVKEKANKFNNAYRVAGDYDQARIHSLREEVRNARTVVFNTELRQAREEASLDRLKAELSHSKSDYSIAREELRRVEVSHKYWKASVRSAENLGLGVLRTRLGAYRAQFVKNAQAGITIVVQGPLWRVRQRLRAWDGSRKIKSKILNNTGKDRIRACYARCADANVKVRLRAAEVKRAELELNRIRGRANELAASGGQRYVITAIGRLSQLRQTEWNEKKAELAKAIRKCDAAVATQQLIISPSVDPHNLAASLRASLSSHEPKQLRDLYIQELQELMAGTRRRNAGRLAAARQRAAAQRAAGQQITVQMPTPLPLLGKGFGTLAATAALETFTGRRLTAGVSPQELGLPRPEETMAAFTELHNRRSRGRHRSP